MEELPPNPLRHGLLSVRRPEPLTLVLFGASGDLARRKIAPALYNLAYDRLLPDGFAVVGVARRPWDDGEFARAMAAGVAEHSRRPGPEASVWSALAESMRYVPGDFADPATYRRLDQALQALPVGGSRLYYLATPPESYDDIVRGIGSMRRPEGFGRVVVEKPFGRDLASARRLNSAIHGVFAEDQVYRIDHYLGKETVQNLLVFRFANTIFEPVWNRNYVDHVQITAAESIGIGSRASYYETAGAIRDMLQNHLLQLLCLTAMEPPADFSPDSVRDEKVKVLRAIPPLRPEDVARGQYGPGWAEGRQVPGYRQEQGVAPDSATETMVAARLQVDNWRWQGVPFFVRAGKRLPRRVTEIAVQFRPAPHLPWREATDELRPNVIVIRVQPDEGITLSFGAKVPGQAVRIRSVDMDFLHGTSFTSDAPEAYERLLLDAMCGVPTLFTRHDEVEAAWSLLAGILDGRGGPAHPYAAGTWGPEAADALIAAAGRRWRRP
jgi:glucose-6-phosphate 1-dehydrogenase